MNKYEFEAIKAELARNILNSDDEALIEYLRHCYAESQGQGAPCRYTLNEVTREIETEVQGTFKQYPLRLAWAITIRCLRPTFFRSIKITRDAAVIKPRPPTSIRLMITA